jgi:hypothetical protein
MNVLLALLNDSSLEEFLNFDRTFRFELLIGFSVKLLFIMFLGFKLHICCIFAPSSVIQIYRIIHRTFFVIFLKLLRHLRVSPIIIFVKIFFLVSWSLIARDHHWSRHFARIGRWEVPIDSVHWLLSRFVLKVYGSVSTILTQDTHAFLFLTFQRYFFWKVILH